MDIYPASGEGICRVSVYPDSRTRSGENQSVGRGCSRVIAPVVGGPLQGWYNEVRRKCCQSYFNRHTIRFGLVEFVVQHGLCQSKTNCMNRFPPIFVSV